MTPELKAKLEKESELALEENEGASMSLWPVPANDEEREYWKKIWRKGARSYAEKLFSIREEVEKRKKEKFSRSFKSDVLAIEANGAFNEASEILSIIDKHLNQP